MKISKSRERFLNGAIRQWESDGTLTHETAEALRGGFSVESFDFKTLGKYAFRLMLFSVAMALAPILVKHHDILRGLFTTYSATAVAFVVLSAFCYTLGFWRKRRVPENIFGYDSVIAVGALFTAASTICFLQISKESDGRFTLWVLPGVAVYAYLALRFRSRLLWVFALVSAGFWFGMETGYASGWEENFHGMGYPLRFALFGALLIAAGFLFRRGAAFADFSVPTRIVGMLCALSSLYILSIVGNRISYGRGSWTFAWGCVSAAAALAALVYGLRRDDAMSKVSGAIFIGLHLLTFNIMLFAEFNVPEAAAAVIFAVIAALFWLTGHWAESRRNRRV